MSYSNADTGNKAADPYKEKNLDNASLKDKVQDLTAFVEKTKLCLMTTLVAETNQLATRAMALAATVSSWLSRVFRDLELIPLR